METKNKKFDLEERTAIFSENVINLSVKIKKDVVTIPIISQLVRAATSIGANYYEANGASSKKDFVNKIFICKKEAKETQYWLRIIVKADPDISDTCRVLWQEAKELAMIFSSIASKSQQKV